ncbi:MAG: ATP-dependent sacrificial sulfur transferase LarE [Methanotrichaceae archaeon]|nr:ATP-dependent sacrificial sulfur transferase LarE [Methanotrichaceae archaeon]
MYKRQGGVDSSLLAKVASDVLSENALCVLLDSETLPESERRYAEELAKSLGLNLKIAKYSILEDEEFVKNPLVRCYLCKKRSARLLKQIAEAEGISCIADGVNISDYDDFRPGIKACDEEEIWHPFVEVRITKQDIRDICRLMDLSFWNKPSSACLSSRIPYGQRITEENLRIVDDAEEYLKSLGFSQLRVRYHGKLARIELMMEELERALKFRDDIAQRLKSLGFDYVTLDLDGFRSGSMNEVLWTLQR